MDQPSREIETLRTEFPAIFRFDGQLYMEFFDIDRNEARFIEVHPAIAEPWLRSRTKNNS